MLRQIRRSITWRTTAASLIILGLLHILLGKSADYTHSDAQLHLFVTATNSDQYLCQFLLSAIILNYPTPVLVNYEFPDANDVLRLNVAKVDSIAKQLQDFSERRNNDLVLIVDGRDTWFQLPPDVLIRRYYEQIKVQNAGLVSRFGSGTTEKSDIRQSIIFEADKTCWPNNDWRRASCWAAPPSPRPEYSYGPYEDSKLDEARRDPYHARPRWLNSGSVIGPAQDLRLMFEDLSRILHEEHHPVWDQYFYSQVFGIQEYTRSRLEANPVDPPKNAILPNITISQKTEYHIGLDYQNELFQAVGYEAPYLAWIPHDGSLDAAHPKKSPVKEIHRFKLPADVVNARRPFEMMQRLKPTDFNEKYQEILKSAGGPSFKVWRHLPVATNMITKTIFPLMHFSFEKEYRDKWWQNMWFYPYARDLFKSSTRATSEPLCSKKIDGRKWYNRQNPMGTYDDRFSKGRRDGAFTGNGVWRSFNELCIAHDEFLFGANYDNSVLQHE